MKKLLTLALTGVLAAAALAVESEPSNTVGFISRSVAPTQYVTFSACPAGVGVAMPAASVLGTQGFTGDQILSYDGTSWAVYGYTPDNTWGGLTLDYNGYYVYRNNHGAAGTLVVAGDVIPEGTTVSLANLSGTNYVGMGNPLPMVVDMDTNDLGLAAAGFPVGGVVLDYDGTSWASYTYDGTTYGFDMLPGRCYILRSVAGVDVAWQYTVPTGALTSAPATKKVTKAAKVSRASELN